ncbi:MAG: GNAT family N-acetyltransferase [Betaproteobacteria bacterium]|jgi:ribosomal protein S18 acetylase RimI-like enzyme|nr:GNAT family N-acetyltransferase [Betaproteobacteria bacterium]
MLDLLDNVTWHALSGPHARFAAGEGTVRRYAKGFSPILGLEDPDRPDFDTLARYCEPGEHFYAERWAGDAPSGWRVDAETTMFKMIWDGALPPPDPGLDAVPLAATHAAEALALATLTRPGPFGIRTIELGQYLGVFADGALVAMAGERMQAGTLREISGVCTHPSFQGRGLARRLMNELLRRELARGETPFLHVMRDNALARDLYRRMGFRDHREVVVRVVARQ